MPHCIIEHSVSLDGEVLMPLVFSAALNSGLFNADGRDIKVRTLPYHNYLTGPTKSDFVHIVLKILSGRSAEQKQLLTQAVLAKINTLKLQNCSVTIEVVDMDRACYAKCVS